MAGPWEKYGQQPAGDPIIAPADPYKQAAEQRAQQDQALQQQANARAEQTAALQNQVTALTIADKERAAEESARKAATLQNAKGSAAENLKRVIEQIDFVYGDVYESGGWGETGTSGRIGRGVPIVQTAGKDLEASLQTIDANSAFAALQAMRDNSPTGGALGNVTEMELKLLKSSIANLDPNQSQDQFIRNLATAKRAYLDMLSRVDPEAAKEIENRGNPTRLENGAVVYDEMGEDALTGSVTYEGPNDYQREISARADRFEELGGEAGALDLAKSGITFGLTDEASGVGNVLAQALTGDFNVGQNYREGRDTQREIERRARERTGGLGVAAELVGAGGAVRSVGNAALSAARGLRAGGQAVNRGAIQGRMVRDATIGGAGIGALGGFGYGEGLEGSATNALLGGAVGGVIGNVGQRVGNALANRAPSGGNPPSGGQVMQAADDLGIEMLPADVGGVGTRMATGGVSSTFGGIPIAEGAERAIGSAAAARNRIASEIGEVSDDAGAGQAVGKGFREFADSSLQRGAELFERVPIPAESKVSLNATRNELMKITEGFRSNPELSRLWANYPKLKQTLEALTPTDTRPAGQIRYTEASDSLRYAEDTARRAKDQASNIIAEKAAAREGYMNARERFAALDLETTPAQKLSDARKALQNAEARWLKVRDVLPDERAISAAERAIKAAKSKQDVAFIESRQPPMGGELSWKDMKRFRSIVGEIIGQPGIKSDGSDIAALRKLYGAISRDMEATAAATSPRALTEFSRANQFWRGREKRIEDVFAGLLGPKGDKAPEKVFQQINRWSAKQGGDFARLARTIRSMPQDEANTVRSTIVQRMGMARPSNQEGAGGEVFSPTEFATQWQGMSQRAKSVLFPDKQHRADLEKLARVMEGMKGATKYQNFSRTALGVNTAGQGALAISNLPFAAALAGLQYGAGKLLASPKFARMIAGAPKAGTPQARKALSARLANLAKAEPALANEIGLYRTALDRAANDNAVVMQSAAQDQNAEERR